MSDKRERPFRDMYLEVTFEEALKRVRKTQTSEYKMTPDPPESLKFTEDAFDKVHEITRKLNLKGDRYEDFNRTIHFIIEVAHELLFQNIEIMDKVSKRSLIRGLGDPTKHL